MSSNIHGTCSICGGAVTTPQFWGGALPPIPRCDSCGARKKGPYGATIEMEPTERRMSVADMLLFGMGVKGDLSRD